HLSHRHHPRPGRLLRRRRHHLLHPPPPPRRPRPIPPPPPLAPPPPAPHPGENLGNFSGPARITGLGEPSATDPVWVDLSGHPPVHAKAVPAHAVAGGQPDHPLLPGPR